MTLFRNRTVINSFLITHPPGCRLSFFHFYLPYSSSFGEFFFNTLINISYPHKKKEPKKSENNVARRSRKPSPYYPFYVRGVNLDVH